MTEATEAYELGKMGSQFVLPNAQLDMAPTETKTLPPLEPSPPCSGFTSKLLMEPALAGSMMAIFLAQTSLQNFYLRTACSVDLKFPQSVCDKGVGEAFREAEIASQELVSRINVSRGFVGALISTIILLFLGPWSDCSRRRKPLIIISLLGMCISTFNVLIMITFPVFSSVWVLYLVQIPMSVGGNFGLLLAAGFSYIGDVCHASGRNVTMTMGKHRAAIQCASVLGSLSGPLLYRCLGFYGVFPIVFFLQVSSLLFVVFRVRDVSVNSENRVSVLNVKLPLAAVRCLVAPREQNRRCIVLMMMLVALADRMILAAEVLLWYMYARNKYHWDDIMFGGYLAYRNVISFIGTMIILRVFKARLNLSDELVGALSGVSLVIAELFLMAARSTAVVFIVPLLAIIAQGSQVVQRPIINKQIRPDEQGKIYSVVGALEQACQMAVSPIFSLLYSFTADKLPDAWLIPCVAIACVSTTAFAVARTLTRRQRNTDAKDVAAEDLKVGEEKTLLSENVTEDIAEDIEKKIALDSKEFKRNYSKEDNEGIRKEFDGKESHESNENLQVELNNELEGVMRAVDVVEEQKDIHTRAQSGTSIEHQCIQ